MHIHLIVSILLYLVGHVDSPESDSLFIKDYHSLVDSHNRCLLRKIRRSTSDRIEKNDTVLLVPSFSLRKDVQWDYTNIQHNSKYASWEFFDIKRYTIDAFIKKNADSMDLYMETGLHKLSFVRTTCFQWVLDAMQNLHPDGVFLISGVPGWFFICNNKVIVLERHDDEIELHEDSCDFIGKFFTEPTFLPIYSKDML